MLKKLWDSRHDFTSDKLWQENSWSQTSSLRYVVFTNASFSLKSCFCVDPVSKEKIPDSMWYCETNYLRSRLHKLLLGLQINSKINNIQTSQPTVLALSTTPQHSLSIHHKRLLVLSCYHSAFQLNFKRKMGSERGITAWPWPAFKP